MKILLTFAMTLLLIACEKETEPQKLPYTINLDYQSLIVSTEDLSTSHLKTGIKEGERELDITVIIHKENDATIYGLYESKITLGVTNRTTRTITVELEPGNYDFFGFAHTPNFELVDITAQGVEYENLFGIEKYDFQYTHDKAGEFWKGKISASHNDISDKTLQLTKAFAWLNFKIKINQINDLQKQKFYIHGPGLNYYSYYTDEVIVRNRIYVSKEEISPNLTQEHEFNIFTMADENYNLNQIAESKRYWNINYYYNPINSTSQYSINNFIWFPYFLPNKKYILDVELR